MKDRTRAKPSRLHSTRSAAEADVLLDVSGIRDGSSYDGGVYGPRGSAPTMPGPPACASAPLGDRSV
ncbi:hypothetical protein GCM10027072_64760 [Streptomyces bullii]